MGLIASAVPEMPAALNLRVSVLGGLGCWIGDQAQPGLSGGSQRLLAFLVLRDRPVTRVAVAGSLWPEVTEGHAFSSLRSTLARLDTTSRQAVIVNAVDLRIAGGVGVDIRDAQALAHRLLDFEAGPRAGDLSAAAVAVLSMDLLPDWYDDWVLIEAENWRQLRLDALEALARRFTTAGRLGEATGAALAAVNAEPLRESARRVLLGVHLANGNQSEAISEFERYRTLLEVELGVEPTAKLRDLVPAL
jgi:DNA-binding SARP family transcriptional activator